jgi:hypothetical protein
MLFITQLPLSIARVPLKHALIDEELCFGVAGAMLSCCQSIALVMLEHCSGDAGAMSWFSKLT